MSSSYEHMLIITAEDDLVNILLGRIGGGDFADAATVQSECMHASEVFRPGGSQALLKIVPSDN